MWTEYYLNTLDRGSCYEDIGYVALEVLKRNFDDCGMVCGPITSGLKPLEENLAIFRKTIDKLSKTQPIFNQLPMETALWRLWKENPSVDDLCEGVYAPLFESGIMNRFYFIHGWEHSRGSNWEHNKIKDLKLEINYLSPDFHE